MTRVSPLSAAAATERPMRPGKSHLRPREPSSALDPLTVTVKKLKDHLINRRKTRVASLGFCQLMQAVSIFWPVRSDRSCSGGFHENHGPETMDGARKNGTETRWTDTWRHGGVRCEEERIAKSCIGTSKYPKHFKVGFDDVR